jgi:hypothetical protein
MNPKIIAVLIRFTATLICVGAGLGSAFRGQSELRRPTQEERSVQPLEALPAPDGQKARTARLAKNTRYNGGVCDLKARTPDQLCIDQVWPRALPVIPVKESAFALLGQVEKLQPYLSTDRTHIYTEITVRIEDAFTGPSNSKSTSGRTVIIDQIGGTITMTSGQVIHDGTRVDFLGRTHVGGRYILFAKRIHHGKDLTLIRGYELREGRVFKLTADGNPGDVLVSSIAGAASIPFEEKAFIQAVRKAVQGKRVHQASYIYDAPK